MLPYFLVLFTYLLSDYFSQMLGIGLTVSLVIKMAAVSVMLFIYRKDFRFRVKFDILSIIAGAIIFFIWVGLENLYPHLDLSVSQAYYNSTDIILKLLIGVALAPVVEEIFTRFFLLRWIIDKNWKCVPVGKYTFQSFLATVLFFGFSHTRWLSGLMTGIILNLLFYKRKDIGPCILAHAVANLALGIYVVCSGNYSYW